MEMIVGIVLFNPEIEHLKKCIVKLKKNFDKIILFDNSECNKVKLKDDSVIYISYNKNLGIAFALNAIMRKAEELGYKWVVTFDQDSDIPENLVEEYSKYTNKSNIGIICPQVIDKRRKYMNLECSDDETTNVNKCITSASCTNIEAWKKAGEYDDWLFIDLVDNDFSKRVKLAGYEIIRVNKVILQQEYGVIKLKNEKIAKFYLKVGKLLNNNNISKLSYRKEVNPMRIYYTNRNVIYLNRKHKNYGGIGYESYYCRHFIDFFLAFNIASILRGKKKGQILKAILSGVKDGIIGAKSAEPYIF